MHVNTTELNSYLLRADGVIGVDPEEVPVLLTRSIPISKIRVIKIDEEVKKFNQLSDEKLELFEDLDLLSKPNWILPKEFLNLDLKKYVQNIIDSLPEDIKELGEIRLNNEYEDFKRRNLEDFLRTIIYILSVFRKKNVVWGVGRGSSCASYLLFKIGLHSVDSLKYNIPLTEFFHD